MFVIVVDNGGDIKVVGRRTKKGLYKPFRSASEAADALRRYVPEDLAIGAQVVEIESLNSF